MNDRPRLAATRDDNDYTLTIEEVADRYAHAGHPRTIRTLQRYCASGHLDSRKVATTYGDKYLITPQSVARHIAEIVEIKATTEGASGRGEPRLAATNVAPQDSHTLPREEGATGRGQPRLVAAAPAYIALLEKINAQQAEEITIKNTQIAALLERDRETNFLIRGLQALIGLPARHDPADRGGEGVPPESAKQI